MWPSLTECFLFDATVPRCCLEVASLRELAGIICHYLVIICPPVPFSTLMVLTGLAQSVAASHVPVDDFDDPWLSLDAVVRDMPVPESVHPCADVSADVGDVFGEIASEHSGYQPYSGYYTHHSKRKAFIATIEQFIKSKSATHHAVFQDNRTTMKDYRFSSMFSASEMWHCAMTDCIS